jgi:GMP synthase-like glutamine amidotransferase
MAMARGLRVALLDLLVERAEFGHGGNMEILFPLAEKFSTLEVLLLTPQFQSDDIGFRATQQVNSELIQLVKADVPTWVDDFPFVAIPTDSELQQACAGDVTMQRVALPSADTITLKKWLTNNSVDVVICTGSRRNVSMWEPWMEHAASLLRASAALKIPTLGICFGHQLLCKAFGGKIIRATSRTDSVVELELSEMGLSDPIFTGLSHPVCLFTHQDHVVELPSICVVLGEAPHNSLASIRLNDKSGNLLPVWGLQFHPEVEKNRIARSVILGHISEEEAKAFDRIHDGAVILANFAAEVGKMCC